MPYSFSLGCGSSEVRFIGRPFELLVIQTNKMCVAQMPLVGRRGAISRDLDTTSIQEGTRPGCDLGEAVCEFHANRMVRDHVLGYYSNTSREARSSRYAVHPI